MNKTKFNENIHTRYFANFFDLGVPELFFAWDPTWLKDNSEEIGKIGSVIHEGGMFIIPNPHNRLLFAMKWA